MSERYIRYTLDDLEKSSAQKKFTYISFFAGGGGSSAGYKLSGGDCRFINEFQQVAVDTYLANWPGTTHICDDIKNIDGHRIMDMTGLKVGELDILDGSPPCPPFSMAGSKQKGWKKEKIAYGIKQTNIEDLTWEMIRIAGEMKPKVIVCENVKGLTMEYAHEHLMRMVNDFQKEGYTTVYRVFNGIHFGVPQKRERTFIVSVRNDILNSLGLSYLNIESLVFPREKNEQPTLEEAIGDLRDDEENILEANELSKIMKNSSKYKWLKRLTKNPDRVMSIGDDVVGPFYDKLIAHKLKMGTKGIYSTSHENMPKRKNSLFQSRRIPWNQASHTLTEQGMQPGRSAHLHPSEDRVYTTKEGKRIMTLPEDYKLLGNLNERLARIGLMVAPMMMHYLSTAIYENILEPYNKKI